MDYSMRHLPAVGANAMIFPNAVYMPTLDSSVNTSRDNALPSSLNQSTRNFGGIGSAVRVRSK